MLANYSPGRGKMLLTVGYRQRHLMFHKTFHST
jgi:hypothetical protein